ncbi:MAG: hypothetical protein MZV65_21450 [Chromatiales bacterium]|nr:hypothetical protein [Chromatiales bacterium]
MSGELIQRDVPQTVISFSDYRLFGACDNEQQLRQNIEQRGFGFLIGEALERIVEHAAAAHRPRAREANTGSAAARPDAEARRARLAVRRIECRARRRDCHASHPSPARTRGARPAQRQDHAARRLYRRHQRGARRVRSAT